MDVDGWIVEDVHLIIFKVINLFWNQIALGCNLLLVLSFDANSCFCAKSLTAFRPERNCETSRPWKPNLPRGRSQRPSRNNWKRWDRFAFVKIQFAIFLYFAIYRKYFSVRCPGKLMWWRRSQPWRRWWRRSLQLDLEEKTLTHKFISHFSWEFVELC